MSGAILAGVLIGLGLVAWFIAYDRLVHRPILRWLDRRYRERATEENTG